jgi:Flp pilus assembly protein TadD
VRLLVIAILSVIPFQPRLAPLHPGPTQGEEVYSRAVQLVRAGKLREALEALRSAEELLPNDPKVHNLTGLVLTQMQRYAEAEEAYGRALRLAPDFLPARKNRAVNSFSRRDFNAAAAEFEALRSLDPADFVPPLFLGLVALEKGDTEGALPRLHEAETRAPLNSQVLLGLTRAYLLKGERDAALKTSQVLMLKSPDLTDAQRFELGVLLAEFGGNSQAETVFTQLWEKNFQTYDSGFNLALLRYRNGRDEDALRIIEELAGRGFRAGELLSLQGWIYNRMGRLALARQSLQQAIALEPDAVEHYLDLSMVHLAEGDHSSALQVLSSAVGRGLAGDRLLLQIGIVHQASARMAEAEMQYRRTLEAYPLNAAAYLALANLLLSLHRDDEALSLLARAAEALPQNALVQHMYGAQLLARAESRPTADLEKAGRVLHRALELNPRDAETLYLLGKYSSLKNDDAAAQEYFEQACAADPRHVESCYRLIRIARQGGDLQKAADLARIVERLRAEKRSEEHERFDRLVEESVRGPRGREFKNPGKN